jgi:hypothetical protein
MNETTAQALCNDLLASALSCITNPPARQFVAHGRWAHDCEAVVVAITSIAMEPFAPAMCATKDVVSMSVYVVRCFVDMDDDGNPPAAADITADAVQAAGDLGALVGGLGDRWGAGTLFPSIVHLTCEQVTFVGSNPIGPEGGLAGWELQLTVNP